jgi:hypothetical protein
MAVGLRDIPGPPVRANCLALAVAALLACALPGCITSQQPPSRAPDASSVLAEAYFAPEWSQPGAVPATRSEGADTARPAVIFPAGARGHGVVAQGWTNPKGAGISSVQSDPSDGPPLNLQAKGNPIQAAPETSVSARDYLRTLAEELERNPANKVLRKKLICCYYFEGDLTRADELLKGTENWDDDEVHLLRALVSYRTGVNNVATNSLEAVRRKWRGQFQLELRNILFCREIRGRSDVVRFEKYEFFPGQKGISLYFEIENFMCRQTESGQYEVAVKASLQLGMRQPNPFDPSVTVDRPVNWPELPDNERLSFKPTYPRFIDELPMYVVLDLPKDIQPGNYALTLVVEDTLARKQSTPAVLEFRVR